MHGAPAGHARPGPEALAATFAAAPLQLANAVHQVERVEQGRGDGHGAVDPRLALLQRREHQHAGGEVHAIDGERQRLRQAAADVGQRHAEGAHLAVGMLGLAQEGVALAGVHVFPGAVGSVEPQASLRWGRGGAFRMPGPGRAPPWRVRAPLADLAAGAGRGGATSPGLSHGRSRGAVLVAAAALPAGEPGEGVDGGAGVWVRV